MLIGRHEKSNWKSPKTSSGYVLLWWDVFKTQQIKLGPRVSSYLFWYDCIHPNIRHTTTLIKSEFSRNITAPQWLKIIKYHLANPLITSNYPKMSDEVGKTQLHNSTKIAKSALSPVGLSICSPTKNAYQSPSLEVSRAKKQFEKQKHLLYQFTVLSLSINPDSGLDVASVSTLGLDPLNIFRPWPSCRESDSWPLAHPALKLASPWAFLGPVNWNEEAAHSQDTLFGLHTMLSL